MRLPISDWRVPVAIAGVAATAAGALFVWASFAWILDDSGAEEKFVARLVAHQIDQTIRTAKIVLGAAALRIDSTTDTQTGAERALAVVSERLPLDPQFSAFEMRGPDGRVLVSTQSQPTEIGPSALPDYFRSLVATPTRYHVGYVERAADGEPAFVMTIGRRIDDLQGNLRAIAGLSVDLARLRTAIDTSVSLRERTLLVVRADGVALFRFPEPKEDVAGADIRDFPVLRDKLPQSDEAIYRAISPFDGVERLGGYALSPGRDIVVLSARGVRDILRGALLGRGQLALGGGALLLLSVAALAYAMRDTQRRRRLERERENLFESLELAEVAIAIADSADQRLNFVNRAFERLTGYSSADMLGKNCRILQGPLTNPATVARLREALAANVPVRTDILNYTKGGKPYWADLSIAPVLRADGTARAFVSAFTDVTARVEMADRLRRALEEARQAARAKDAFLARMSHELRTPLNAVIGFADLMQMGVKGTLSDAHRGYVEDIARSGRHLLGIVEDMLEIVRLAAGQRTFAKTALDLAQETREAARMVFAELDKTGATLELRVAEPAQALGDAQAVRQIVVNLLANAARHGRACGRIVVTTGHGADGFARLEVADDGPGFPPDLLHQIGKPFIGHAPDVAAKSGVGLGLAIVSELAEHMGGRLQVANQANGALVCVDLPVATARVPQ
jgi:PAS domain S-box-containing protein